VRFDLFYELAVPERLGLSESQAYAETLGQIAPRDASSVSVQDSFDEQPIVGRRASYMAFAAGQKIPDPVPLVVA